MKDPKNPKPGDVYGRLTLIEKIGYTKHGHAVWHCRCSCGTDTWPTMPSLRRGNTKSCGCLRTDKAREREERRRAGLLPAREYKPNGPMINTDRFLELLDAKKYPTYIDAAIDLNIGITTLRSWRKPGARAQNKTIRRVARVLGADPSELIAKEETQK